MYPFYEKNRSGDSNFISIGISSNMCFPPHLHSYVELVYVIEGTISVSINDKTKDLHKGDLAVSFPNDIHSYNTESSSKIMLIIFSPEIISSYFSRRMDKTLDNPFMLAISINEGIASLFDMLYFEYKNSNNKYVIKGLLYTILGKLDSGFILKNSSQSYNNTIQNLLRYIESHYHENISLQSIAKDLGFSKFYLSRIFTNKIGYQFNDYVNRLRINLAQKLLSDTDLSVLNVALECGFESQRNFNRIFKEYTAVTPTEFRSSGTTSSQSKQL
jgi:AraC-like DNA-binding protein